MNEKNKNNRIDSAVQRFVREAGHTTQAFGLGRVTGQIYAYLYFSREPKNLNDLQADLNISKGSASTIIRQLEKWQAVRKVNIQGDRKDYFTTDDNFGRILKNVLNDSVSAKMNSYSNLLVEMKKELPPTDCPPKHNPEEEDLDFLLEQLEKLRLFHNRVQKVWDNPLIRKLLR